MEDSICFLDEFIAITKSIAQNDAKSIVLEKFQQYDVFLHLTEGLEQLSKMEMIEAERLNVLKIHLVEALNFLLQIQITPFFKFIKSNDHFLTCLISTMYTGDQGLQILIADLFKIMMDSSQDKKNDVLEYFYSTVLPKLVEKLSKIENKQSYVNFAQEIIEILNYCVTSHGYRIRYFIIQHKVIQEVYNCLKLNNKTIALAIIRLLKNIISSKDDFLIKSIANHNLLEDIFKIYFQNCTKYNLISSACLELFEKIRGDSVKKLIVNIVENFREDINERNLQNVFEKIFLKYEQYNEGKATEATPHPQELQGNPQTSSEEKQTSSEEKQTSSEEKQM